MCVSLQRQPEGRAPTTARRSHARGVEDLAPEGVVPRCCPTGDAGGGGFGRVAGIGDGRSDGRRHGRRVGPPGVETDRWPGRRPGSRQSASTPATLRAALRHVGHAAGTTHPGDFDRGGVGHGRLYDRPGGERPTGTTICRAARWRLKPPPRLDRVVALVGGVPALHFQQSGGVVPAHFSIDSSCTSNTSVAFGGIGPGAVWAP